MPNLQVTLKPRADQDVIPGEFAVEATFTNDSSAPTPLNLSQASHPSVVLEVRDSVDKPLLLPPPSAPDERDLEPGQPLSPGQSLMVQYGGFLDRSLPAGKYRVRYFSPHPSLGGSKEDPLKSNWVDFTIRQMREFPLIDPLDLKPRDITLDLRMQLFLCRWWWWILHWLRCLLPRIFLRRLCDRVLSREVDEARSETISNAPPGAEAWNGTYAWRARFRAGVDEANCRVTVTLRVRLNGTITAAQRTAWEQAIEGAWSKRFKFCCRCCCCAKGYDIVVDIQFVSTGDHQVVNVGNATTNMGNWGADDTVDVRHEFGHMLGALDEYFTVNGVDWGDGRQAGGSIMNNPANSPAARHYDLVRAAVEHLLRSTCRTRAVGDPC